MQNAETLINTGFLAIAGHGSVWLERTAGGREVAGNYPNNTEKQRKFNIFSHFRLHTIWFLLVPGKKGGNLECVTGNFIQKLKKWGRQKRHPLYFISSRQNMKVRP